MAQGKFDFSKLKDLGSMDITDMKKLFEKKEKTSDKKQVKEKLQRAKNIVSFDIGTSSLKVVTGKTGNGSLAINKCIEVSIPAGTVIDGKITNIEALKDIIKTTFEEYSIKEKNIICTTNSSAIINREITIPKVQKEELDTVVRFEIQQYLPINLEEYILQFTILDEIYSEEGTKLKVNVIAFPEKVAKEYYDLFTDLELNPYVLDVNYNSISKVANYLDSSDTEVNNDLEGSIAYIDMGANATNVTVLKNGRLDFTRIIKAGGCNMDYYIAEKLNISSIATEKVKIERADLRDVPNKDEINEVIKRIVDSSLDDLERILQFYQNKASSNEIKKIYIYGGVSKIRGIDKYIEGKLNIKTEKVRSLKNISFSSKELRNKVVEKHLNAIGAMIRL